MFKVPNPIESVAFMVAGISRLEQYPEYNLPNVTRINQDGKEEIIFTSDVYNLFNQERFAGIAQNIVDSIRSNILASGSQYQSVLDGLSDEELMSAIKPRSLQSPSELMDYSKRVMAYLDSRMNENSEPPTENEPSITEPSKPD